MIVKEGIIISSPGFNFKFEITSSRAAVPLVTVTPNFLFTFLRIDPQIFSQMDLLMKSTKSHSFKYFFSLPFNKGLLTGIKLFIQALRIF